YGVGVVESVDGAESTLHLSGVDYPATAPGQRTGLEGKWFQPVVGEEKFYRIESSASTSLKVEDPQGDLADRVLPGSTYRIVDLGDSVRIDGGARVSGERLWVREAL